MWTVDHWKDYFNCWRGKINFPTSINSFHSKPVLLIASSLVHSLVRSSSIVTLHFHRSALWLLLFIEISLPLHLNWLKIIIRLTVRLSVQTSLWDISKRIVVKQQIPRPLLLSHWTSAGPTQLNVKEEDGEETREKCNFLIATESRQTPRQKWTNGQNVKAQQEYIANTWLTPSTVSPISWTLATSNNAVVSFVHPTKHNTPAECEKKKKRWYTNYCHHRHEQSVTRSKWTRAAAVAE